MKYEGSVLGEPGSMQLAYNTISGAELLFDIHLWAWAIRGRYRQERIGDGHAVIGAQPFLCIPPAQFKDRLTQYIGELPIDIADRDLPKFPIDRIVGAALEQGSSHWVECALEWIKQDPYEFDNSCWEKLKELPSRKKRYSQKLRQQVICILKNNDK